MQFARLLAVALAGTCAAFAARAADWRPLPGAPEVQVDIASLRSEGSRASAWLKWWGMGPVRAVTAAQGVPLQSVHRTTAQLEFDCTSRLARVLAVNAWDARGAALLMSSVPGAAAPVRGEALAWAYDAVCEAARSAGRSG